MIKTEILDDGALWIFRLVGDAELQEIIQIISTNYPKITQSLMWDFSKASLKLMTSDDFKQIRFYVFANCHHKKAAYLVQNTENYMLLLEHAQNSTLSAVPFKTSVFIEEDEALAWLREE